jgi:hypothetical protein
MSSTLTALTEATTFATTDLGLATVSSNSRKYTFATLGKLFGNGTLPFAVGTITTSQPLTLTQTWNSSGVLFTGMKIQITDTARAANSRAIEVVMPSAGDVYSMAFATSAGGTPVSGFFSNGACLVTAMATIDNATVSLTQNTVQSTVGLFLKNSASINFSSDATWWGSPDIQLWRDSEGALGQRSGTIAQYYHLYRTFTDSSNYERLALQSGSGYIEVAAETAGTGTDNLDIRLTPAGTGNIRFYPATATPAGGSTTARITYGSTAGLGIYIGSGVPTVSAAQGSLYLRSDGSSTSTRLYVNTNGSTTWTNVTTAA